MTYVQHVDAYYAGSRHPAESDEVAKGFRAYYEYVRSDIDDPDAVLWELELYILGNAGPSSSKGLDALVVLMYFFGRCDIFEAPPPGWAPSGQVVSIMPIVTVDTITTLVYPKLLCTRVDERLCEIHPV